MQEKITQNTTDGSMYSSCHQLFLSKTGIKPGPNSTTLALMKLSFKDLNTKTGLQGNALIAKLLHAKSNCALHIS